MPSSKKQRGKQRRAATILASNNADMAAADMLMDGIRRGSYYISYSALSTVVGGKHPTILGRLADNGLLNVLLGFLSQCEQVDINDIRTNIDGRRIIKTVANPLDAVVTPNIWFNLITALLRDGNLPTAQRTEMCRLQCARAMGPMIRCICSEEFFRSTDLWYLSICPFLSLLETCADE